jgi:tripartite-type tricarboxylate transporter receptor subunit TctC
LLAGRIQVSFSPASTVMPHVAEGKLVALASTALKRASVAPNLPTMAEAGLPGFETGLWFGLLAPAGTPKSVVDRINAEMRKAVASPDFARQLAALGLEPASSSPAEFHAMIKSELERWTKVIREAGITAESAQ